MLICAGVLLTMYAMQASSDSFKDSGPQIAYACGFNFVLSVLALVIASTAIAQEKESDTWTLLLASPVTGKTIVWGKALGVLRRLFFPFLLVVGHFVFFGLVSELTFSVALLVVWIIFSFNAVWVATGVYLSLKLGKVTVAVVLNLLLAFATYAIFPALLGLLTALTEKEFFVNQSCWYLPYYYLGTAIDRVNRSYSSELSFVPLDHSIYVPTFYVITLVIGLLHLVAAGLILAHTAHHFDAIVGRRGSVCRFPSPSRQRGPSRFSRIARPDGMVENLLHAPTTGC